MPSRRSARKAGHRDPYDPSHLPEYERLYRRTGNPLYAWESWRIARHNGLAIPEWVGEYLDRSAESIFEIARQILRERFLGRFRKLFRRRPKTDIPAAVVDALEFSKGRGHVTAFSDWVDRNEKSLIAELVARRMEHAGESMGAAAAEVAWELKISASTVERAYRSRQRREE